MELRRKIDNYIPLDQTVELVRDAKIVLLVGIAGAGKDTTKREMLQQSDFRDIISHTTRPPRDNNGVFEQDGVDYHFVTIETAEQMIDAREFVEVKHVHGQTIYGTSAHEIQIGHDEGRISITDVDVQGVDEYKVLSQDVIAIFLLPPTYDVWRQRLSNRYATIEEFESEWPKRRASAIQELEHALSVPYYHFIINNQLDETVRIASEIAQKPEGFNRKDDEARLAARDILEGLKSSS